MRHVTPVLALAFVLGGCSYAWMRPDATPAQAQNDERACRTQAASVVHEASSDAGLSSLGPMAYPWNPGWYSGSGGYGWWPDPSAQLAAAQQRLYDRCMRARGYNLVRVDRKTGEPR